MDFTDDQLEVVVASFKPGARLLEAERCDIGHINDTYFARLQTAAGPERIVLQRINHHVFTDPPELMRNFWRATVHLKTKVVDPGRNALTLFLSPDRQPYAHIDEMYWRAFNYVENTVSISVVEHTRQAREAARAFAEFQKQLVDLPGPRLHETIVNFHCTPVRFRAFQDAVAKDPLNRATTCRPEIDFVLAREAMTTVVTDAMANGGVPERITHNDTKINNILFDKDTDQAVCVIDLDTLMPGSVLYDFGDMVRSSAGEFKENEKDLSKVTLHLELFEALVEGYLGAADFLTPREFELIPFAGPLLTFECGSRFLADYLLGDEYFRIHYPEENLDRARTQFKFVEDMEAQAEAMATIVSHHRR